MIHSRRADRIDTEWRDLCLSIWGVLKRLIWAILLPFRLVAAAWRISVAVGVGIVRFSADLCAALLGLAFVLFVGTCLIRALLHPLF